MGKILFVLFAPLVMMAAGENETEDTTTTPTPIIAVPAGLTENGLETLADDIVPWDPNVSTKLGWCFVPGLQWEDFSGLNLTLLFHESAITASPEECQAECVSVPECVHFTWWNNTGDCFLGTADAYEAPDQWGTEIMPIVGPKVCPNTLTTTNTTTTTTVTTTTEAGGLPWWAWLLIILGVLGIGGAIAAAVLMKKEPPKKKKTRAIKPAPAPVETKAEPVPTYTRVIHPDGRMEQVTNYAPPAGMTYAAPAGMTYAAPMAPVSFAAPTYAAPTYAAPTYAAPTYAAPMAAPGSFVVVPGLA